MICVNSYIDLEDSETIQDDVAWIEMERRGYQVMVRNNQNTDLRSDCRCSRTLIWFALFFVSSSYLTSFKPVLCSSLSQMLDSDNCSQDLSDILNLEDKMHYMVFFLTLPTHPKRSYCVDFCPLSLLFVCVSMMYRDCWWWINDSSLSLSLLKVINLVDTGE